MEHSSTFEILKTSVLSNIWAERLFIIDFILATIISFYIRFNLSQLFELLFFTFLFVGIVFLGFVAIVAHIRYYFYYERRRKVELYADRMVIKVNYKTTEQIFKNDIIKITIYDKRHVDRGNLFPTLLDSFYYLDIISKNKERIILTCLLDIKLKKKIAAWYGQELKHIYQFFPFPLFSELAET